MNGNRKNHWLESWHIAPSSTKSYDFLDGIRGIAILLVVACHVLYFDPNTSGGARFLFGIFEAGAIGVTIFFALSGFLISLAFWKKKANGTSVDLRRYAARRFWKIAPPLLLTVVLFTPIYIHLYGDASTYITAAVKWLTGMSFVVPVSGKFNKVMWSLIVEVHFYVLLPLAFMAFRKIGYITTLVVLSGCFFFLPMAAQVFYSLNGMSFSFLPNINVRFPSKLDAFSAGILVAGMYQADFLPKRVVRFASWGLIGIALALLARAFTPLTSGLLTAILAESSEILAYTSTGLLLFFIKKPEAASKWLLDSHILRWLGLISYEWYLLHQVFFLWMWPLFGEPSDGILGYIARVCIPTGLSLVIAALLYRYFSLPILKRTREKNPPQPEILRNA